MEFHLEYLKSKYAIDAEELRSLSRVLGYPTSTLSTIFNVSGTENVSLLELSYVMQSDEFEDVMNQRYNLYPSEWNKHIILTSILLLSYQSVSFQTLNLARCVFNFYENEDGSGITTNKTHLLQYLKMCGRLIAPLRLIHRLKHMHRRLYCPDRLQLWEFLELILWSDVFESMENKNAIRFDNEKENELYKLSVDDISLIYTELKCFELENIRYIQEELTFPKGQFSKVLRIISRPVNFKLKTDKRNELHRSTRTLSKRLNSSNHMVTVGYGSCFKYCDLSKLITNKDEQKSKSQMNPGQRISTHSSTSSNRPKTAPIVSNEDIEMCRKKVEDCKNDIKSLNTKYEKGFELDMEYMYPGFRQRWMNRPRQHESCLTQVNMIKTRKPSAEHLRILSRPRSSVSSSWHKDCYRDM